MIRRNSGGLRKWVDRHTLLGSDDRFLNSRVFIHMRLFARTFHRNLAVFAICSFLFAGCVETSSPGKAQNGNATPDDQVAVAALEKAGCSLKKDAAGLVTEIAVSSDTDFSETLKHLVGVPNITLARFGGPGMNDKGMAFLSSLKSLKRLDLTDCSAIGDDTLKVVGGIHTIEVLTLRRAGFTDAGLEPVRNLSKLRAIDLRNTNVTDAGVAHLAGIKTLVDVQLEKSKVTDAGIEYLRGLPLKSLNLNYTAVTDAAMPAIGSMATHEPATTASTAPRPATRPAARHTRDQRPPSRPPLTFIAPRQFMRCSK